MKRVKIKYNLLKYTKLERQNILDPPLGNVYVLDDMHTPEFWTQLLHMDFLIINLKLKIGVSIILLKNINQSSELWNETWLIITQLDNHVWETKVISSCKIGKKKFSFLDYHYYHMIQEFPSNFSASNFQLCFLLQWL